MSRFVTDVEGDEHEIVEDESVLVLAQNQECAREWMREQGLSPYARQFKVMPSPRALEGYRPQTIVVLSCFSPEASLYHREIRNILARSIAKSRTAVGWIEGACP